MGKIDHNDAAHKFAADWQQKGQDAFEAGRDKEAARDFNIAADRLRAAGDFEGSSDDCLRAALASDADGDLKGAADNREAAGADMLKTNADDVHRDVNAKGDYKDAGNDRMDAGTAEAGRNHKEAAKQYRLAEKDFTKAADAATRLGNTDEAKKYSANADLAREEAAAEAGEDHMDAGKNAGRNHKEAAKQYGLAQKDFTEAAKGATKLGNLDDAENYSAKADLAGAKAAAETGNHEEAAKLYGQAKEHFAEAAKEATKLHHIDDAKKYSKNAELAGKEEAKEQKFAKPEDGLPAHKNPNNRL